MLQLNILVALINVNKRSFCSIKVTKLVSFGFAGENANIFFNQETIIGISRNSLTYVSNTCFPAPRTVCDAIYNGTIVSFRSPGHPDAYSNNMECGQVFNLRRGHAVELTFEDFVVEFGPNCMYDKVQVNSV